MCKGLMHLVMSSSTSLKYRLNFLSYRLRKKGGSVKTCETSMWVSQNANEQPFVHYNEYNQWKVFTQYSRWCVLQCSDRCTHSAEKYTQTTWEKYCVQKELFRGNLKYVHTNSHTLAFEAGSTALIDSHGLHVDIFFFFWLKWRRACVSAHSEACSHAIVSPVLVRLAAAN